MSTERKKGYTWIQCQTCGKIYQISRSVPIDETFIAINCSECGITAGLNLGDEKDDIYLYMNPNVDNRVFI